MNEVRLGLSPLECKPHEGRAKPACLLPHPSAQQGMDTLFGWVSE